jgi:hypothetical protein
MAFPLDNGGAAFPFKFTIAKGSNDLTGTIAEVEQCHVMTGMSLRDYFAAKAMQAIIANDQNDSYASDAMHAYLIADAMLEERNKP